MSLSTPNPYDSLPYPSHAWTTTYPDHLAAVGRLLGLSTAHPNACRVLELGCSDGGNLIPMAVSLPGSEFVGIDLAAAPIERGIEAALAVGATSVRLVQGDIAEIGSDLGEFDYVIAHGVYSWVPESVRAATLRVIRERLRPNGLAFVSYNALPGDQIRGVVREMMRMHTSHISDPVRKVQQARALLQLLSKVPADAGETYRILLQSQIGRTMLASDAFLYHDDLAEFCQPFFFTEFTGAAQRAGLEFAFEAVYSSMSTEAFPEEVAAILEEIRTQSIVAKEQYLDFFVCKGFRQTVLCQAEVELDREFNAARMFGLRYRSMVSRTSEGARGVSYEAADGASLATADGLTVLAFEAMIEAAPASLAFEDLAARAGATSANDREELALLLYEAHSIGLVDVRVFEPAVSFQVSERPLASAWARHEHSQPSVTNLYHEAVPLDARAGAALALLDGTNTLAEIATKTGQRLGDIEAELEQFAKAAVLVG